MGPRVEMIVRINFCSNSVIIPVARCQPRRPVFVHFKLQDRSQEPFIAKSAEAIAVPNLNAID